MPEQTEVAPVFQAHLAENTLKKAKTMTTTLEQSGFDIEKAELSAGELLTALNQMNAWWNRHDRNVDNC